MGKKCDFRTRKFVYNTYIQSILDQVSLVVASHKLWVTDLYDRVFRVFWEGVKPGVKDKLPDMPHLRWLKRDMTWCHNLQANKLTHFKRSEFLREDTEAQGSVLERQQIEHQLEAEKSGEKENASDSSIDASDTEREHVLGVEIGIEAEVRTGSKGTKLSSLQHLGVRRCSGYYGTRQCAVFYPKISGKFSSRAVTGRSVDFWRKVPWEARENKHELCRYIEDNYALLRPKSGLLLKKLKNGELISQREGFRRKRASKLPEKSRPDSSRRRARAINKK